MKRTSNSKSQARRITYPTLFWLFLIGSVIGFILEGLWAITQRGGWENHSATVWGPFCIIYGIAAAALYCLSMLLKGKNILTQFLVCALAGSALEYFASLFQEICFGSTSWNYSDQFLNIGGRVSLKMTLIWGILGVIFTRYIFPVFRKVLQKMHGNYWNILCILMSIFMTVNLLVTSCAVLRWRRRLNSDEALPVSNPMEEFLDENYGNDEMSEIFPNMMFS